MTSSRQVSERRRVVTCLGLGAAVSVVLVAFVVWQLAVLVGWTVAASCFLGWVWRDVSRLGPSGTHDAAVRQDDSRASARTLTIVSSVASLGGVLFGLARASEASFALEIALTTTSILTVIASWSVVHCVFMLRYAHLYYDDPLGGVDFPGDDEPTYGDFAYLSLTVGMTYQVSDTDITQSVFRRTLLVHALLSYLFGAVIIAVAIGIVAGLA